MEIELKLTLQRQTFQEIMSTCRVVAEAVEQENTFFDSSDRKLRGIRWALRLRREGKRFYLTVKGPSQVTEKGVYSRLEFETELEKKEAEVLLRGFTIGRCRHSPCRELAARVGDLAVDTTYRFVNRRVRLRHAEWIIEVDETQFGEETHYELELEVPLEQADRAREDIEAWFGQNGWAYEPSSLSKLARAEEHSRRHLLSGE